MRHGRFITTALVATAAMAIGPASASAATVTDDTAAQFGTGPATNAWAVEPGSVRLRPTGTNAESDNFDGPLDPAKWTASPWDTTGTTPGDATVSGGTLTVDGRHVNDPGAAPATTMVPTAGSPLVLEFRATFGGEAFQHVGFGNTLSGTPWAIFSSGDGTARPVGLWARIQDGALVDADTMISATTPTGPHDYRIEWSTTDVKFFMDGTPVASGPAPVTTGMRPVVSDATAGVSPAKTLSVDWLGMGSFASSGTFTSQVHDAGDTRAVWGALTPTATTPAGTAITIKTRSGNTPTPDGTWSSFQDLVGGQIQSPIGRYIQYEATLTGNGAQTTPSLDKVDIAYDIDNVAPTAAISSVDVSGATANVSFSSPDSDIKGFECSLDGGGFAGCASPKAFGGLTAGAHTVVVRPIDKAGNVGPTVSRTFSIASSQSGGGGGGGQTGGGSSGVDKTAPKVTLVAKSLKASKKGAVSVTVGCPATEATCEITLKLKNGAKTVASKTVTVKGGKTKTVTLQLNKATRQQLKHRSLKLSSVLTATDA
ncbi:MAG: hypothetical protein ACXVFT_28340, partial [Solirubrobacteraceae bacterium]